MTFQELPLLPESCQYSCADRLDKTSPPLDTRASPAAPVAGHGCRQAFLDLPSRWLLAFLTLALTLSSGAITQWWLEARVAIFRQLPDETPDGLPLLQLKQPP
jgi:hypothetical protein